MLVIISCLFCVCVITRLFGLLVVLLLDFGWVCYVFFWSLCLGGVLVGLFVVV